MAIDLNAIRKKLNNLQTQTGKQNNLWKPEPGKQTIRIVPYQYNKDNPFQELYFHYNLGKKIHLSPVTFGKADPVVEFCEQLKATGSKEDWQMARKMEPKMRTYVPVIVRGQEGEGVRLWGFGKTVYQELLSIISDPDYGDITDPMNGRDITVEFTAAEGAGSFPKTSIRVKPNQSQVTDNKDIAEKITSGQKEITEIFKEVSYDDLKEALSEWLNPEDVAPADAPAAAAVSTGDTKKVDDVNQAFDELFKS
tara:strand:+ start:1709 stop:2464 length:756 start_codon:yes stop_codon:yes gene_type:complete